MIQLLKSTIELTAPFIIWTSSILLVLFSFLQTPFGTKVFDVTFKYYFDQKISFIKHDQDIILTELRHTYEQEIESLKADLSHYMDRSKLSNEREYQAMIATWEVFITAFNLTRACVVSFQSLPDLNNMEERDLENFLDSIKILPLDREYIRNSRDKNSAYSRVEANRILNEAQTANWNAREVLIKQSVFIPEFIEKKFDESLSTLRNVWSEQRINFDSRGALPLTASIDFIGEGGDNIKNSLRDIVRSRILRDISRLDA
jgi:hypothetical protein